MKKPILLLIGGGSGSGKTTVAQMISEQLKDKIKTQIVCQDSYYIDLPDDKCIIYNDNFNFDHPNAFEWDLLKTQINDMLDGKVVYMPKYDYNKKVKILNVQKVEPCELIILEGIYALYDQSLNEKAFLRLFVETPKDECLARRLKRDIQNRGREIDSVISQWRNVVRPMYDRYIDPLKFMSNLIIPWDKQENERALKILELAITNFLQK